MSIADDDDRTISCVAVDGKIHVCLPWENTTACEEKLKVSSKQVEDYDRTNRFNCYECTF